MPAARRGSASSRGAPASQAHVGGDATSERAATAAAPLRHKVQSQIDSMKAQIEKLEDQEQELNESCQLVLDEAMQTEQTAISQLDAIAEAVLAAVEERKDQLRLRLEEHRQLNIEPMTEQVAAVAEARDLCEQQIQVGEAALLEDNAWLIQAFPSIQIQPPDCSEILSTASGICMSAREGLVEHNGNQLASSLDGFINQIDQGQLDGFELIKLKTASSSRANLEHGAVAQGPAEDKGPDDPDDTAWEARCRRWASRPSHTADPWHIDIVRTADGAPVQGRQRFKYDSNAMPLSVEAPGEYMNRKAINRLAASSGSIRKSEQNSHFAR